jgi:lycopene cyclase domain-containing protein
MVDLACIVGPLFLSFDKKVSFISNSKAIVVAITTVGMFFIVWDIVFTQLEIWGFNSRYLIGLSLYNLPIEEVLFFVAVPYAGLFSYECINVYFKIPFNSRLNLILNFLISLIALVSVFTYPFKLYTLSVTFTILLTVGYTVLKQPKWYSNFMVSYMLILIPFLISNGVLTGYLTPEPVVWYNNTANLGIRLGSIPIEDFFYGYVLLFWNTVVFETIRTSYILKTKTT